VINKKILIKMFLVIISVLVNLHFLCAITVPENPCPKYFHYERAGNFIEGVIEVDNDYSGFYKVLVNATLPFFNPERAKKLNISVDDYDLLYERRFPTLRFRIKYQSLAEFPKITSVMVNDRQLCYSPTPPSYAGSGITNLWAVFYFSSTAQKKDNYDTIPTNIPSFITNFPIFITKPNYYQTTHAKQNPTIKITFDKVPSFPYVPPTYPSYPDTQTTLNNTLITVVRLPENEVSSNQPNDFFSSGTTEKLYTSIFIPTQPSSASGSINSDDTHTEKCGLAYNSMHLFIGGTTTDAGEFPWMAAIFKYKNYDGSYEHLCTGNLISDRHVITSGHCIQYSKYFSYSMEELVVAMGRNNLANWAVNAEVSRVEKIHMHPKYRTQHGGHDLVIMKLARNMQGTIIPVCLYKENRDLESLVITGGIVAGWAENNVKIAVKQNLQVVSHEECLRKSEAYSNFSSDGYTFCAGKAGNNGPCTGDIGAGFYVKKNSRMYLRGLFTYGLSKTLSCDSEFLGVFADLATEHNWMNDILRK